MTNSDVHAARFASSHQPGAKLCMADSQPMRIVPSLGSLLHMSRARGQNSSQIPGTWLFGQRLKASLSFEPTGVNHRPPPTCLNSHQSSNKVVEITQCTRAPTSADVASLNSEWRQILLFFHKRAFLSRVEELSVLPPDTWQRVAIALTTSTRCTALMQKRCAESPPPVGSRGRPSQGAFLARRRVRGCRYDPGAKYCARLACPWEGSDMLIAIIACPTAFLYSAERDCTEQMDPKTAPRMWCQHEIGGSLQR